MTVKHFTQANVFPSFPLPYVRTEGRSLEDAAITFLVFDIIGAEILIRRVRESQEQGEDAVVADQSAQRLRAAADIVHVHRDECGTVLRPLLRAGRALWPVAETVLVAGHDYSSALDALLGVAEQAEQHLLAALSALQCDPPIPVDCVAPGLPQSEVMGRLQMFCLKEIALSKVMPVLKPANAPVGVPDKPKKLLFGWTAIAAAVGEKSSSEFRKRVARLNRQCNGPIVSGGRGAQPAVDREALVSWWDKLLLRLEELKGKRSDTQATVKSRYKYGQSAEVVPGIDGSTRKGRRKDA